jgi:acyl carrier protein
MVPSFVCPVGSLPLTANGKLDRAALPRPDVRGSVAGDEIDRPLSPMEEFVAGVFTEVLAIDRIRAGDDFFDIGGHSLSAVRALTRINDALGTDLPIRTLFETPTVEAIAAVLVDALVEQEQFASDGVLT